MADNLADEIDSEPVAVWEGKLTLFGIEVQCCRLSDGTNVIEADSMRRLLTALFSGESDPGDLEKFARFQRGLPISSQPDMPSAAAPAGLSPSAEADPKP